MAGDAINQLKNSLSNGVNYINGRNYVGLVSYSSKVTVELPIAKFDLNQRSYFQGAVNRLTAGGTTSTYEAITVALKMVKEAKANNPNAKTMIFLLSDGLANGKYTLDTIENVLKEEGTPIYTIGYTSAADTKALESLSKINESTSINADSDDIIYKIKSLFNSQM
jgi:Ca-activated chloride channel family protein